MRSALRIPPAALRATLRRLTRPVFDPALPWSEQRRRLDALARHTPVPRGTEVSLSEIGGVAVERVAAPGARTDRAVLHLHGGGYCVGSPVLVRGWAARLSRAVGAAVLVPDYRLAPESPYPAGLDDARRVWDGLVEDLDPSAVVLSGDSAGAGLALGLAQGLVAGGTLQPAGLLLLSPWLDLTADRSVDARLVRRDVILTPAWLAACAAAYAGPTGPGDPGCSPLRGALSRLPPLLVQAAGDDLLVGDADRLVRAAHADDDDDVTYLRAPGLWHDFPLHAGIAAAADRALDQAARFIVRVVGEEPRHART